MTTCCKWVFEPVGPMGGATGTAFVNTLQGAGIAPAAELAREAIQNSCDAAKEDTRRVRVVFRINSLNGDEKQSFLNTLQLNENFSNRLRSMKIAPENCLSKTSNELHLVYIEDYETVGLRGDPHDRQSNFHRLLLSIGDSAKVLTRRETGGSYGYGKSALSLNSRIRTIVAYSAFEPDETGATARLMGCTYLDAHQFGGKEWTGRGWFGVRRAVEQLVVDPLRDDDAHAWAQRLGFRPRTQGKHGTSILIVDSDVQNPAALVEAIEDWWWPRLVDHELDVRVVRSGQPHFLQPKQRPHLLPFIECYSLAIGRSGILGPHQKSGRLQRFSDLELGGYGLVLLGEKEIDQVPENRINCVALIRSPKMVVEYAPLGRSAPPAVGVFLAAADIDEILKLSEPPNHDRWDAESRRLEIAEPNEETARAVVRRIRDRLKSQMRAFQADATPPKPPEERRLSFLERELASFFRPDLRDGEGRGGASERVEIRFREGPVVRAAPSGGVETFARVAIRLREDAEDAALAAVVRVRVPVLIDDHGSEDELLPVKLESERAEIPTAPHREHEFRVNVSKNEWLSFSIRSGAYDPGWSVKVVVEVVSAEAVA